MTRRVEELAKSDAERARETYDAVIVERTSDIPLRRLAKAEEIANLVVFLTSEKASYITGAATQIDGGLIKSLI